MIMLLFCNVISANSIDNKNQQSNIEQKAENNIYEDWEVERYENLVRYSTHGKIVHGHRFGWIKKGWKL